MPRLRNPAGPLLMVNPRRRRRSTRRASSRIGRSRFPGSRRRTVRPKVRLKRRKNPWVSSGRSGASVWVGKKTPKEEISYKRSLAAKKAARTRALKKRKRSLAAKKAARTRKKATRKTTRRKTTKRKTAKRKTTRRKTAKRKYTRKKATKRRTTRRRKSSYSSRRRSLAMKKAWRKRRGGMLRKPKGRKPWRYRTSRGRKYKQPTKKGGRFRYWRNPKHFLRTRNPGAMDILLPVVTSLGGMAVAGIMMSKISAATKAKFPVIAGFSTAALIPGVAGVLAMKYLTKKMPKQAKIIYGVSMGMMIASGISLYNQAIAPMLKAPVIGSSVAVAAPAEKPKQLPAGQTSQQGYVRSLGQFEPAQQGALDVIPYGIGEKEKRVYDFASWSGIYQQSIYE